MFAIAGFILKALKNVKWDIFPHLQPLTSQHSIVASEGCSTVCILEEPSANQHCHDVISHDSVMHGIYCTAHITGHIYQTALFLKLLMNMFRDAQYHSG